jgi:hypothetical protein
MADQWYCDRESQRFGPFSSVQLKQLARDGRLRPTDLLWKEGMPQAVPARQAAGLFPGAAAETKSPGGETSSAPRPTAVATQTNPAARGSATDAPPGRPSAENEQAEFTYAISMRRLIAGVPVFVAAGAFFVYLALYYNLSILRIVALPEPVGKLFFGAMALFFFLAPFYGLYFAILDRSNPRKIVLEADRLMVPQTNIFNRARSIPYASICEVKRLEIGGLKCFWLSIQSAKVLSIKHAEGKVELAAQLLANPADLDTIQAILEQRLQQR